MKKLRLLIIIYILLYGVYPSAYAKASDLNKSIIFENAFHQQNFLIGEYLDFLNPDKWILSGLSIFDRNIYFSSYPQFSNINFNKNPISSQFALQKSNYQTAIINKIAGLQKAHDKNYENALLYFLISLKDFTRLKDSSEITILSQNLSKIYFLKGDFNASINFLKVSESHVEKMNLIDILLWKAQLYLSLGKSKEAELLILNKIILMKHTRNQEQQCYFILGKIYLQTKLYTPAKWFFIQADETARKSNQTERRIQSLLFLAKVKNEIKDYSLAAKDLFLVKNLLLNGQSGYKLDLFLESAQTYSYLHDLNKSLVYRQNYNLYKKQFIN